MSESGVGTHKAGKKAKKRHRRAAQQAAAAAKETRKEGADGEKKQQGKQRQAGPPSQNSNLAFVSWRVGAHISCCIFISHVFGETSRFIVSKSFSVAVQQRHEVRGTGEIFNLRVINLHGRL